MQHPESQDQKHDAKKKHAVTLVFVTRELAIAVIMSIGESRRDVSWYSTSVKQLRHMEQVEKEIIEMSQTSYLFICAYHRLLHLYEIF